MTKDEKLKDLLIGQLQMLRVRLVENISDIDDYVDSLEIRFKTKPKQEVRCK